MKIQPSQIGFDIDGVVADTGEAFLRLAKQSYGITGYSIDDITEFEVSKCLPLSSQIIDDIFDYLMREPIDADMKPMPGALPVLCKIAKHTPLILITARPFKKPIMKWLAHNLPPETFNNTKVIAMGDHDGKLDYIKRNGLTYFVDDRHETCRYLHKEGITPIVYSQPWNRGKHNFMTVNSWECIEKNLNW